MTAAENLTPGTTSPDPPPRKGKSWRRRLILAGVVLVLLLLGVVLGAPWLVSRGVGHRQLREFASRQLGLTVAFDDLALGWTGPLSVRGFTLTDATGRQVLTVDGRVNGGLIGVLGNLTGGVRTAFSGRVDVDMTAMPEGGRTSSAPWVLPALPVELDIDHLDVSVEIGEPQPLALRELSGRLAYVPGGDTTLQAAAQLSSSRFAGEVGLDIALDDLISADGRLTPNGARARVELRARSDGSVQVDGPTLDTVDVSVTSTDLSGVVKVTARGTGRVEGGAAPLEADVQIGRIFDSAGRFVFEPSAIQGSVLGSGVPTAVMQPFLAGTPIVLSRDLGPRVDVEAAFEPGTPRTISVVLKADAAQLELAAEVDGIDGIITGRTFRGAARVDPRLLSAWGVTGIDTALPVEWELDSYSIPAADASGHRAWDAAQATGRLRAGAALIALGPELPTLSTTALEIGFVLGAVQGRLDLDVTGGLESMRMRVRQAISGLMAGGEFAMTDLWPIGEVRMTGITADEIGRWIPDAYRPLVAEVVRTPAEVVLVSGAGRAVAVQVTSGDVQVQLDIVAGETFEELQVATAVIHCVGTPALLAALPFDLNAYGELLGPVPLEIRLTAPMVVPMPPTPAWLDACAATGVLSARDLSVRSMKLPDAPVHVTDLAGPVTVARGGRRISADLRGTVAGGDPSQLLGPLRARIEVSATAEGWGVDIDAELPDLALTPAIALFGQDPQNIIPWTGATANATARVNVGQAAPRVTARVTTEELGGTWIVELNDDLVALRTEDARLTVPARQMKRWRDRAVRERGRSPRRTADKALPLTPIITRCVVPLGLLSGGAFDPAAVDIDISLVAEALALDAADRAAVALEGIKLRMTCTDLAAGIDLEVTGTARSTLERTSAGTLELQGRATGLYADGALDVDGVRIDSAATMRDFPTVVLDGLFDLQGYLVDAIGREAGAELETTALGLTSGTLKAQFSSAHGTLTVPEMAMDEGVLKLGPDPIVAELEVTRELRQRLLAQLHPVFEDIRTTEERVKMTVTKALIPPDGNVELLNADMRLDIGDVHFEPGILSLTLLAVTRRDHDGTIPGTIEPVNIRIRDGVVHYQRFALVIDEQRMIYTGTIDLNTRRVNLRTELPLGVLSQNIGDLGGLTDDIVVPILTTGTLGNTLTRVDESDLVRDVLQKGIFDILQGGQPKSNPPPKSKSKKKDAPPRSRPRR